MTVSCCAQCGQSGILFFLKWLWVREIVLGGFCGGGDGFVGRGGGLLPMLLFATSVSGLQRSLVPIYLRSRISVFPISHRTTSPY